MKIKFLTIITCLFSSVSFADDLILECVGKTTDNKTKEIQNDFRIYTFKGDNIPKGGNSSLKGVAYQCKWSEQEIKCDYFRENNLSKDAENVISKSKIIIQRISGEVYETRVFGLTSGSFLDYDFQGKCVKSKKLF